MLCQFFFQVLLSVKLNFLTLLPRSYSFSHSSFVILFAQSRRFLFDMTVPSIRLSFKILQNLPNERTQNWNLGLKNVKIDLSRNRFLIPSKFKKKVKKHEFFHNPSKC